VCLVAAAEKLLEVNAQSQGNCWKQAWRFAYLDWQQGWPEASQEQGERTTNEGGRVTRL